MSYQYVQPGVYLQPQFQSSYSVAPHQQQQQYYLQPDYSSPGQLYAYPSPPSTSSPSSASSSAFSPVVEHAQPRGKGVKAARRMSSSQRGSISQGNDTALQEFLDHDPSERPTYSVKALCEAALRGSTSGKLTLSQICEAIQERYPYFKTPEQSRKLRNSARHDLSIDPRFVACKRSPLEPGRGAFWMFDETKDINYRAKKTGPPEPSSSGSSFLSSVFGKGKRRASMAAAATPALARPAGPVTPTVSSFRCPSPAPHYATYPSPMTTHYTGSSSGQSYNFASYHHY